MVLLSEMTDCLKMYKISGEVKVYWEYHGDLESRTESRKKKFNWGKNPGKDRPGWCAIAITICNGDAATQSEMHKQIQTS